MKTQIERTAYHECGHVVFGYFTGYYCDELGILPNGNGYSRMDYQDDTMLAAGIINVFKESALFNSLSKEDKSRSPEVAHKVCLIHLAGPIAEHLYLNDRALGTMNVELSGPDLERVQDIDAFLRSLIEKHDAHYLVKCMSNIADLIRSDEYWGAINVLSKKLLESPGRRLSRIEIEEALKEAGFTARL